MRFRRGFIVLIFVLVIGLGIISNFYFEKSKDISLAPGDTVYLETSIEVPSTQDAVMTSNDLGRTVKGFDGVTGFGFDSDWDGQSEFYYYNGERVGKVGLDGSDLFFKDGRGEVINRDGGAIFVRVDVPGDNSQDYVVLKLDNLCDSQSSCPTWLSRRSLGVYALNDFGSYTEGDRIALKETYPNDPNAYAFWITTKGSVVVSPSDPLVVAVSNRDMQNIAIFELTVNSQKKIDLTFLGETDCPTYGCHRGNDMRHTELCKQNQDGGCSNQYDEFLFADGAYRIEQDGSLSKLFLWADHNGADIPIVQGGSLNFQVQLGTATAHQDSINILNVGTPENPDYKAFVGFDFNGMTMVSFDLFYDLNGNLQATPIYATSGGSSSGGTSQELAYGYVKGNPDDKVIINGRYAFRISDGAIVGDINSEVLNAADQFSMVAGEFWPTNSLTEPYVIDIGTGYEINTDSTTVPKPLQKVLPEVVSTATPKQGNSFKNIGGVTGVISPTQDPLYGGVIGSVGLWADYDEINNEISFWLTRQVGQNKVLIIRSNDELPVITNVNQEKKDLVFAFVQQVSDSAKRGFNMWDFVDSLNQLSVGGVCNLGEVMVCYTGPIGTQSVGICQEGIQTCDSSGNWGTCVGQILPQTEVCSDGLDNNCNNLVDECVPNIPSGLTANFN